MYCGKEAAMTETMADQVHSERLVDRRRALSVVGRHMYPKPG